MKLLLLKILLQRRARDEGFTLPMVIALGLVMLLLGAVSIVKSSEENINAISQNSSSDAIAIAEVGVTKYRELLNQNRILTIYNHDQWDTNATITAQTCDDVTTAPSNWKYEGTAAAPNDTTKWWEIQEDSVDPVDPIGEYRLVSYTYDIDGDLTTNNNGQFAPDDDNPNATDAFAFNDTAGYNTRGILIVQGRSPDGSEAQIQVEIPLRINNLENFAPVLWVGSGAIAAPGTLDIPNLDDNIVLRSAGTGCSTPAAIAGNSNVISDPRNLPAIDSVPTDATKKNSIGAINTTASKKLLPVPPPPTTPPTPTDNKDDNGRFLYEVTTINVANNDLVTDGIAKVALYTTGDININGNTTNTITIGNSNAANLANFNNGNTTNTAVSSHNLEIYVDGNRTININPDGGTVNIEAFIHAPDATLNITGSGTVNINGAVWVNNFNNTGTATVNIRSDKTDTTTAPEPSYKFYTTSATRTPRPLTSTPTDWIREEVQ